MAQASLFDQTAENRARNKTIMWWVVQLSYEKNKDEMTPVFGEGSYEDKIKAYDILEEVDDSFIEQMLEKLSYYVSFWYITKPGTREELEGLLATASQGDDLPEDDEFISDDTSNEPPLEEVNTETPHEESKEPVEEAPAEKEISRAEKRRRRRKKHTPSLTEEDVGESSPQKENV